MKKILVLFLLLFAIQVQAAGIYTTVARGTVTQANMKISAVDGTAFVDKGYAYESNFSAGEDGWTATGGTVTGNIDSIGGEDNWLRLVVDTLDGTHRIQKSITIVAGRSYKVTFTYYIPSGQSHVVKIFPYLSSVQQGSAVAVTDTATTVTQDFIASSSVTSFRFYASTSASTGFQDSGGDDVFYIKDVKIEENPLTDKLGHLLRIRDSSGRAIQGFIKAAGTGETEGSDVFSGFDFTNIGIWVPTNATVIDANSFSTTSSNGRVQANLFTIGALYKISFSADETAGTSLLTNAFSVPDGSVDVYRTAIAGTIRVQNNSIATVDVTTMQSQQVLTPSATGVTIVSTKGGSTFNFALKNSAFNYNDSSGYTYEIIQVRQAVLMDSDACLNANATINLTDGSATWACAGIDDSAFQDGKHMITVSDATGKTVLGYYENAGSGDVVNTKSGSTNNWIWKDASFSTAGDYTRKIYYVGD